MFTRQEAVQTLLRGRPRQPRGEAAAFAPANIALCKYWGKRNEELNLPITSSLSVSLGTLGSRVALAAGRDRDTVELNGQALENDSPFAQRTLDFLDLFRPNADVRYRVAANNTVPTAAGFASSASGFAALVQALDKLHGWALDARSLSILARLGSGSACRSIHNGFVEWHAGNQADGMDSFAERLDATWPAFRLGLVIVSGEEKPIASRPAMKRTVETSPLYGGWPVKAARDLEELRTAIRDHDFGRLGRTAESNALAMHATMIAAWPTVLYWLPESVAVMRRVATLRAEGLDVYFTMDAGPNVKLLFLDEDTEAVSGAFPGLQVVAPFW